MLLHKKTCELNVLQWLVRMLKKTKKRNNQEEFKRRDDFRKTYKR